MKVILLSELRGKGGEGDVVDVAQGFAENYLFPNKIAQPATPGNIKQLEERRHNIEKREAERIANAEATKASLDGKSVTVDAKIGEEGQLFGSVTPPRSPRPSRPSSASRSTASASAAATTSRPPASTPSRSTSTARSPLRSTSSWA